MKILRVAFVFFLLTVLLLSCGTKNDNIESTNIDIDSSNWNIDIEDTHISIKKEDFELLNIQLDGDISFFYRENIFYSVDDPSSENPEQPFQTLFAYNLNEQKTSEVFHYKVSQYRSDSVAIHGDKLYITCDTSYNTHALYEVNMKTLESKLIKEWGDNTIFANIYTMNDKLILFNINDLGFLRYPLNICATICYKS